MISYLGSDARARVRRRASVFPAGRREQGGEAPHIIGNMEAKMQIGGKGTPILCQIRYNMNAQTENAPHIMSYLL